MADYDSALLSELVRAHFPARASSLRFTPIRTGKHNASYWVDSDQGRFVLRLAPSDETGLLFYERRMMRQEPGLHALIRAHTSIPVAEVIAYDFSRQRIDRDYLLMTVLPGTPVSERASLTHRQLAQVLQQTGEYLRQLHALTAGDCLGHILYGYAGPHHPMQPQPTWMAAFEVMWNKLLDDVAACGCYSAQEADSLRRLFEQHRSHFDRPLAPCLLHMDIWAQNILIDAAGNVSGVVDFDRALWGDPEIEFAVLDYTGFSDPPFWAGYGSPRDESPSAQIRRRFYLLYEVQKYMPIAVWRGHDPSRALDYKRQCLALAKQLE